MKTVALVATLAQGGDATVAEISSPFSLQPTLQDPKSKFVDAL